MNEESKVHEYHIRILETRMRFTKILCGTAIQAKQLAERMYEDGRITPGEPEVSVTVMSKEASDE